MFNPAVAAERAKDMSEAELTKAAQYQMSEMPPYIAAAELMDRARLRNEQAAGQAPTTTVVQDMVAAAGMPTGGISAAAAGMAPQTDTTQNTSAQPMVGFKSGGLVGMAQGGRVGQVIDIPYLGQFIMYPDGTIISGRTNRPVSGDAREIVLDFANRTDPPEATTETSELKDIPIQTDAYSRAVEYQPAFPWASLTKRSRGREAIGVPGAGIAGLARNVPAGISATSLAAYGGDGETLPTIGGPVPNDQYTGRAVGPGEMAAPIQSRGDVYLSEDEVGVPAPSGGSGRSRYKRGNVPSSPLGTLPDDIPTIDLRTYSGDSQETLGGASPNDMQDYFDRIGGRGAAPRSPDAEPSYFEDLPGYIPVAPPRDTGPFARFKGDVPGYAPPSVRPRRDVSAFEGVYASPPVPGAEFGVRLPAPVGAMPDPGAMEGMPGLPFPPGLTPRLNRRVQDNAFLQPPDTGVGITEPPLDSPDAPATSASGEDGAKSSDPSGAKPSAGKGVAAPLYSDLSDDEKRLRQDKWLALADFGFNLMASRAPTFGQAVGEAGIPAMGALRQASKDFDARKLVKEEMALKRAALAAKGSGAGKSDYKLIDFMKEAGDRVKEIEDRIALVDPESDPAQYMQLMDELNASKEFLTLGFRQIYPGYGGSSATELNDVSSTTASPSAYEAFKQYLGWG